jgi:thiol-disulfide isomerase/thioredoxin
MKKLLGLLLVMLSFAFAQDDAMKEAMAMVESHAWATAPLTDVVSGNEFKIADFAGKNIYVETFATWCPNCKTQLSHVKDLQGKMADDVYIALSVEGADINTDALKKYADDNGLNFIVAVATPEVLASLVEEFGNDITNPPSTPHFFVSSAGQASELITGIEDANKLAEHLAMMAGN